MPEWVREHIGEIALLIYILYPLLKRWRGRRQERTARTPGPADATTQAPEQEQREAPAQRRRKAARTPQPKRKRAPARKLPEAAAEQTPEQRRRQAPARKLPEAATEQTPEQKRKQAPARERAARRPSERDFLEAARERLGLLKKQTLRLLGRAEADGRLLRLAPALREDLLRRVEEIERTLGGTPTLSTIVQDTTVMAGLEELLRYLTAMARQRSTSRSSILAEADAMADACYAPILELARVQGLGLKTSHPVCVAGDWSMSIVPRFAATRVAPLRLPAGFEHDVVRWPAVAHEVAHDFYYSLDRMEQGLHERLALPREVPIAQSERELDGAWLRELFGAWLSEIFADTLGTIMLGPAYVEAMVRAFRNPGSPQRTAAILQNGGVIDAHPPERLRVYMGSRVLHHLGRHQEAEELWERWQSDHPGVRFYYLPLGGEWVGLSDESLHPVADSMVDTLLEDPWPELEGFQLLNIPGLAYLHAEHATVERLVDALADGELVEEDPRWIMAAAVLAATAHPALSDRIRDAARRSIREVREDLKREPPRSHRPRTAAIGVELVASSRRPEAVREAIVLGASLTRRHARNRKWR